MSLYNKGLSPIPDREDAPIFPQDVAYRWRFERDEAWMASRQYREQRDMARGEVDRLRAELDRHRVAGDALADAAEDVIDGPAEAHFDALGEDAREWRSVRGDAPAAPVFAVGDRVRATGSIESSVGKILQRRHGAASWGVLHDHDNRVRWWETSELAHEATDAPAAAAGTFNAELGVAPAAAPTDGQAPADEPRPHKFSFRAVGVSNRGNLLDWNARTRAEVEGIAAELVSDGLTDVRVERRTPAGDWIPVDEHGPAEVMAAATGSVGATVVEYRVGPDGTRTEISRDEYTRDAAAPADDTAAPDTVTVPRVHLLAWAGFLRELVRQDAIRALSARDAVLDNARSIAEWAAARPARDTDGGHLMAAQHPKNHADCADYLRARMKRLRTEVTVSTCRPLVAGPYTTEPFTCPHGVRHWVEPTGEQIAAWARDGVK